MKVSSSLEDNSYSLAASKHKTIGINILDYRGREAGVTHGRAQKEERPPLSAEAFLVVADNKLRRRPNKALVLSTYHLFPRHRALIPSLRLRTVQSTMTSSLSKKSQRADVDTSSFLSVRYTVAITVFSRTHNRCGHT